MKSCFLIFLTALALLAACTQSETPVVGSLPQAEDPLTLGDSTLPESPKPTDAAAVESPQEVMEQPQAAPVPAIVAAAGSEQLYDGTIPIGFTEDGHAYIGALDAPVVIEEYSDFQCPFCATFFEQSLDSLLQNEIANGDAVLIFYDFPLSIHPQAPAAANAARCAGEQGALSYWEMHDALFRNFGDWSVNDPSSLFSEYAQTIGLDVAAFDDCVSADRYAAEVEADFARGSALGVRGTPTFAVNGQLMSGAQPYATFVNIIARAKAGESIAEAPPAVQDFSEIEVDTPQPITLSDNIAGSIGDPNAPVTIVEFTDYQCPFCSRHANETMPAIMTNFIKTGRVHYVLKDLPLDDIHPLARITAAAARCASEQDAFWPMHDMLFARQAEWAAAEDTAATLIGYAETMALDGAAFEECLTSGRYDAAIEENFQEAQSYGITGTPFFVIQGFPVISGAQSYELFEQVIEWAENDRLVDEIMNAMRRQIAAQQQQQQQQAPQPTGPVDVPIGDAVGFGDPNAPVVVVEYTDYQCPFCRRHHTETFGQIAAEYIDNGLVYYVIKDFPLDIHPQADTAAVAARCAREQEQFEAMHNMLFERQSEWNNQNDAPAIFSGYASELGLDTAVFESCLADSTHMDAVYADFDEGASFGVRGTPAFFINGRFVNGAQPFSVFQQVIDGELSR